jgi:nucleoside 2-deoxyribosyltransferase
MSVTGGTGEPGSRGGAPRPTRAVYLAHPIDNGWFYASPVKDALTEAGFAVFDPQGAWTMPSEVNPTPAVTHALYNVMGECDGMLACLPTRTLTIGTVLEIAYAASIELPTVIHGNLKPSWALASLPNPPLVIPDLDEAVAELKRQIGDN